MKNRQFLFKKTPSFLEEIMAYKIDKDACTNCSACAAECPVEAIHEKGDVHEIDADTCIDCGTCENVCPADAISPA
jgi:ferredoxin